MCEIVREVQVEEAASKLDRPLALAFAIRRKALEEDLPPPTLSEHPNPQPSPFIKLCGRL
ncbi:MULTISPECIES: hypothetical protein [unclassified Microcoleus]|uniref:hypothetical protein n=1 Tax=unclassified Microcoleus TaxID=2642155 RepID=UPI002FCF4662